MHSDGRGRAFGTLKQHRLLLLSPECYHGNEELSGRVRWIPSCEVHPANCCCSPSAAGLSDPMVGGGQVSVGDDLSCCSVASRLKIASTVLVVKCRAAHWQEHQLYGIWVGTGGGKRLFLDTDTCHINKIGCVCCQLCDRYICVYPVRTLWDLGRWVMWPLSTIYREQNQLQLKGKGSWGAGRRGGQGACLQILHPYSPVGNGWDGTDHPVLDPIWAIILDLSRNVILMDVFTLDDWQQVFESDLFLCFLLA